MKVLTVKQMRDFEIYTKKSSHLNDIDLMKKAGTLLTRDFIERAKPTPKANIKVFAGLGNNGGDALKMAIELKKEGFLPKVFVIGNVKNASKSFLYYFDLVGKVDIVESINEVNAIQEKVFEADYIIEGLFGIGLSKDITDFRKQLIEYINLSDTTVYSIDIPSGLNPNSGIVMGISVKADFTGVIGYYKFGNLLNDAMDYHGEIKLIDIGILEEYIIHTELLNLDEYKLNRTPRFHTLNKYSCGLGVFIGGKPSMMGSIQMAAYSGLKSGLGISYVLSDLKDNYFTQFYPELIVQDIHNDPKLLDKTKVFVYGPGLSKNPENKKLLMKLLKSQKPLVIDATGLEDIEQKAYPNKSIILTPHLGELSKFLNVDLIELKKDPIKYMAKLTKLGFHVLLKGSCNILATESKISLIQVQNTGLATAGSGDVLAGIIAGSFDSNDIQSSLEKSIYIHREASLYAKKEVGEISLVASDIINNIHKILR